MNAAAILAIIQLATTLAPPAIELINNLITTFNSDKLTDAERMTLLTELQATLKPMELKP